MDTIILDPCIPYIGPIGGNSFSPKKLVKLEGTTPSHAYGFDINLQCGRNTFPHDDIALQIVVRFLNGNLSLNSSQQGIWGKKMRMINVPIKADQKFEITVLCDFNQYKLAINNEHYCVFPQRIPWDKVSHLSIDGDVSIIRISYESICDATSNTTTRLYQSTNKLNHLQHSDLSASYDTALNRSQDTKLQNSCLKATVIKGCKIIFIFFCVIAVYAVCGGIIYLMTAHDGNDTGFNRYPYHIPSIDTKIIDAETNKMIKEINDSLAGQKKMDEERMHINDALANAKKMDEYSKYYFDSVRAYNQRARDREVNDALKRAKDMDEYNKFFSDLLRTISNLTAGEN